MLISPLITYYINQMQIWSKDSKPLQRVVLIMFFIFLLFYEVLASWSPVDGDSGRWQLSGSRSLILKPTKPEPICYLPPCIRLLQSGTLSLCPKSPQGQVLDNQGSPWSRRACHTLLAQSSACLAASASPTPSRNNHPKGFCSHRFPLALTDPGSWCFPAWRVGPLLSVTNYLFPSNSPCWPH